MGTWWVTRGPAMSWLNAGVAIGGAVLGNRQQKKADKKNRQLENEASAYEADRQQRIDLTRGQIDQAFESPRRQKQYGDYAAALRDYLGGELVRQKRDSSRDLKFALARAGQVGGSVAADSQAKLGDEYSRGALQNERNVQGSLASLKNQDQLARNQLLQLADSGLDATTALRRSNESLSQNIGNANTQAIGQGLGDVFTETGKTHKAITERIQQRRGFGYKTGRNELYG